MALITIHDVERLIRKDTAKSAILNFLHSFDHGDVEHLLTFLDGGGVFDITNTKLYGETSSRRLEGAQQIRPYIRAILARYKTHHTVTNMEVTISTSESRAYAKATAQFVGLSWPISLEDAAEFNSGPSYSVAGGYLQFRLVDHSVLGWRIQYYHMDTLFSNSDPEGKIHSQYRIY